MLTTSAEPVSTVAVGDCLVHGIGDVAHCVYAHEAVAGAATVDAEGGGLIGDGKD